MATVWFNNYPISQPYDWYFDHWYWDTPVGANQWQFFGGGPTNLEVVSQDCDGIKIRWTMPWLWHLAWPQTNQTFTLGFQIVAFNVRQPRPYLLYDDSVKSTVFYRKKIYPVDIGPSFSASSGVINTPTYLNSFLTTTYEHTIPRRDFNGIAGEVTLSVFGLVAISDWYGDDSTLPWWTNYYSIPKVWGKSYSTPFAALSLTPSLPSDGTCGGPGPADDGDTIPVPGVSHESPSSSYLRLNGRKNPTQIISTEPLKFSFVLTDIDGPAYGYRLKVIDQRGGTTVVWDTGTVTVATGTLVEVPVEVRYTGPSLQPGITYWWGVQPTDLDPDSVDPPFVASDFFSINAKPVVNQLMANDTNILVSSFSVSLPSDDITISWDYSDTEPQSSYLLALKDSAGNLVSTLAGGSETEVDLTASVTLDTATDYIVQLVVNDGTENSAVYEGRFFTNARPEASDFGINGASSPTNVPTTTPTFSWRFLDSNTEDTQVAFRIQVSTTDAFDALVWDTGAVTAPAANGQIYSVVYATTPSPVVAPVTLVHGTVYFVRVMVSDGISWSEWSNLSKTNFFVINTAPGDPTLIKPTAGSYSGTLEIQWVPASPMDADGDEIFYRLEITNDFSSGTGWTQFAGPLPSTQTKYALDLSQYPKGTNYAIRVIASDGIAESNPSMGGTSPRISIANHAPAIPLISSPVAGQVVRRQLRVQWLEATPPDIDGDDVFYTLEMTANASDPAPKWIQIGQYNEGRNSALADISNLPNGTDYAVRIKATDEEGLDSAYSTSGAFTLSNSMEVTAFETFAGNMYLGSSDGRLFKTRDSYWQVVVDWSADEFDDQLATFARGTPKISLIDGSLIIEPTAGSTYLLRDTADKRDSIEG